MHMVGQKWMKNKWFSKSREILVSLLFPPRCPVCDEILEPENWKCGIHFACETKLYPVKGSVCIRCGRPVGSDTTEYCTDCGRDRIPKCFKQGKSLYLYKGKIKQTMYRFKYSNKREYGAFFAKKALEKYGDWIKQNKIEAIVPVPMYQSKMRERGYNQAEVFANELAKITGLMIEPDVVVRVKDTTPQKELNDLERKNNLKNAFQKRKSIVQYSRVLVVDDIYTTGSTADAVAREVIKTWDCQVYILTICIGAGM